MEEILGQSVTNTPHPPGLKALRESKELEGKAGGRNQDYTTMESLYTSQRTRLGLLAE